MPVKPENRSRYPRDLTVAAYQWGGLGIQHRTYSQEHYADNEPTAATRRAIVRAAAALNPGGSDVR